MTSRRNVKNIVRAVARLNEAVIVIACCVAASLAALIAVQPAATEILVRRQESQYSRIRLVIRVPRWAL